DKTDVGWPVGVETMWKFTLLSLIVVAAGCQATSQGNINPELQPAFRSNSGAPGGNPYLQWQRGF
ncbi:hypothetical protein AB4144_61550, partial [Rhizobiaceae sp. 2RAB30]